MNNAIVRWMILLSTVFLISSAPAQTGGAYELADGTINAGGGTSSGGPYRLVDTIAPTDAGDMSGGDFTLLGGIDLGTEEELNIKIKKCKPVAGSRPGRDSFTCSGKQYATRAQIVDANQIYVDIWGSDDYLVYSETITVKPIKLKKRKYTYTHRLRKKKKTGYITNLQLDTKKHTFSLKAKKIDLTGLSCPLFVGIEVGDYAGLGEAAETIVNGKKKRIPIRFMRGYADTLRAGKRRVKPRSLEIKGGIAVADWPNPPNLKTQDVTITWGAQEFTIPAGSFHTKKKWNNKYKCEQAPVLQGGIATGIATATVDFKKCTFKLLIKKTNIDSQSGLVDFAIAFDTFDETIQLNL